VEKNPRKSRSNSFFEHELTGKLTDGSGIRNDFSAKDIIHNLLTEGFVLTHGHTFNAKKKSAYGYYG